MGVIEGTVGSKIKTHDTVRKDGKRKRTVERKNSRHCERRWGDGKELQEERTRDTEREDGKKGGNCRKQELTTLREKMGKRIGTIGSKTSQRCEKS